MTERQRDRFLTFVLAAGLGLAGSLNLVGRAGAGEEDPSELVGRLVAIADHSSVSLRERALRVAEEAVESRLAFDVGAEASVLLQQQQRNLSTTRVLLSSLDAGDRLLVSRIRSPSQNSAALAAVSCVAPPRNIARYSSSSRLADDDDCSQTYATDF